MKENLIVKLLVVDDHNLFRSGIVKLLKEHPHISIIGEAENGKEMVEKYFELLPDVVLVDIAMPEMTGIEAVLKIQENDPDVKALFLSMYEGDEYIYKVLKSGGKGLINKNILEDELVYAIETIFNGEKYFRNYLDEVDLMQMTVDFESSRSNSTIFQQEKINYREEQILQFLNDGLSSKEMADKLNLSKKTIDFYRSCLMRKFNLKAASDLVRFALHYKESRDNQKNS